MVNRLHRCVLTVIVALLWTVGGVGAPTASAESVIRSQWYTSVFGFDTLKKRGFDGRGITIGVIDGRPNTKVPELSGVDLTIKDFCNDPPSPQDQEHGTNIIALIGNKDYGVAPGAKIINYVDSSKPREEINPDCVKRRATTLEYLIHKAINDRVDVITIQIDGDTGLAYAAARANKYGIPIVIGTGNDGHARMLSASSNGTIGVGAIDQKGFLANFSSYGVGLTVVAPGTDIKIRTREDKIATTGGTSASAPIVAGALALAKQAWPKATGNQLIHSLIKNATGYQEGWKQNYGWGAVDPIKLVETDPTGHPNTNPLMDKNPKDYPGQKELQDYEDGLVEFVVVPHDPDYIYRGDSTLECNNKPNQCQLNTSPRFKSASPSGSPESESTAAPSSASNSETSGSEISNPRSLVAVIGSVVGGIAALVGVIWIAVIKRRRSMNQPPS